MRHIIKGKAENSSKSTSMCISSTWQYKYSWSMRDQRNLFNWNYRLIIIFLGNISHRSGIIFTMFECWSIPSTHSVNTLSTSGSTVHQESTNFCRYAIKCSLTNMSFLTLPSHQQIVNRVLMKLLIECQSSVDWVSIEMSIGCLLRHQ